MTEIAALISISALLVVQVLAFSFWLGSLSQRIKEQNYDLSHIAKDIKKISDRLDGMNTRLSYLEGCFDASQNT